ncbi:genetic suppressor element 1 [Rhincodon typus]|uniref:genetic suppressor element 1 n=1 Tax=Rhincodon typus TaxID=259920 RepID=UPI00202F12FF|nr:genetic suppressor element 1 [Rhincodon typus]
MMSDKEAAAPRSRKHRLMAAFESGEESPGAGSANGTARLHCFICGGCMSPGREQRLQVRAGGCRGSPYFPFLLQQEPAPGARGVSAEGWVQVCSVCRCFLGEQWESFERSRTPVDKRMYWLKRPHQCDSRTVPQEWNPSYEPEACSVGHGSKEALDSSVSSLSDQDLSDQELETPAPPHRQGSSLAPSPRTGQRPSPTAEPRSPPGETRAPPGAGDSSGDESPPPGPRERGGGAVGKGGGSAGGPPRGGPACFVCGAGLPPDAGHRVHVHKQEGGPCRRPFFPFLWLHRPPPGACPLSPGGSTLVCTFCHASLMQQWRGFEMANVPVLQRLYMVPLNTGVLGTALRSPPGEREPGGGRETPGRECYLCGQDCSRDAKAVCSRSIDDGGGGSARDGPMYFPFIRLLPCPPNCPQMSECGEVQCCDDCYAVLKDTWGAYTSTGREELISSAQAFLTRYLRMSGAACGPRLNPATGQALRAARVTVCLLCGAELEQGREFQLNVDPPGRHSQREPFFPFLASRPRTATIRPVDSTSPASACILCYHDLLEQWWRGKNTQHPSSPWSRQYKVDTFVCFFCRQERKRHLGLKAITVNRLPVFLHTPRVAETLVVDDGEQLTVGACEDCRAMVLAGSTFKQGTCTDSLSPSSHVKDSSLQPHLSSLNKKQSTWSSPLGRGEPSEGIKQVSPGAISTHSPRPTVDVGSWDHKTTSMSHEPKSPSLGMISTATRTTATVSPLNPSSLNGSIVPNGSPAANSTLSVPSAHSASFAAALRKLAKQAEEPRGSSISSESSPVSSPATNHSSPASTPKRGPIGPILVPTAGHSVPSTPPVVTIAPTKTVNGLWRSESRQPEAVSRGPSRERMHTESQHQSEKGASSITSHLLGTPYAFGLTHSTMVQDSRFPPLNLQRPIPHVVTPGGVQEEYLRSFRPYHTGEELRMPSLPPMGLEAATAYYHPSYLAHHPFPHPAFRVDDSYCLSALRSPFYPIASPASLPPLHPSAMHLHLPGMRFPAELSHSSLTALQSERLSERLQMDEELRREREREREREKEREREAEREKEREREQEREKELEREKEKEREREREREMERDRERNREKEMNAAKAMENHYLHMPELPSLRGQQIDDRVKAAERLTPNRPDKPKDFALTCPKAVHPNLHQSSISHHSVPTLISNHNSFVPPGSSSAMLLQRNNEEEKWMAKQRQLRQEKEDRQYQVSEFRQQVLEQHLDIGRPGSQSEVEHRDSVR